MQKPDLYIIAAGKGSRMGGNIPKALIPVLDGEPNIFNTIKLAGSKFRTIFVVINEDIADEWDKSIGHFETAGTSNVHRVPIKSGLGDGHAVLAALCAIDSMSLLNKPSNNAVICWGDVFIRDGKIFDEINTHDFEKWGYAGIVPAVQRSNPYVALKVDSLWQCFGVDFSKYGETNLNGLHDQSIFRFNRKKLFSALDQLHRAFWKNGEYLTPGRELSLLHAFHYLFNSGTPVKVYATNHPTVGFNTPEELAAIQKEMKNV